MNTTPHAIGNVLGDPVDGESSHPLCGGAQCASARGTSQRQLPTDLEHAVSARGYQTDQRRHRLGRVPCHVRTSKAATGPPAPTTQRGSLTGSLHIRGCPGIPDRVWDFPFVTRVSRAVGEAAVVSVDTARTSRTSTEAAVERGIPDDGRDTGTPPSPTFSDHLA